MNDIVAVVGVIFLRSQRMCYRSCNSFEYSRNVILFHFTCRAKKILCMKNRLSYQFSMKRKPIQNYMRVKKSNKIFASYKILETYSFLQKYKFFFM